MEKCSNCRDILQSENKCDRTGLFIPFPDQDCCDYWVNENLLFADADKMDKRCKGCSHGKNKDGGYCYMFKCAPEEFPCIHHDNFSEARRVISKLITKDPKIFALLAFATIGMDD